MTAFFAFVAAGNVIGAASSAADRDWGELLVRPAFAVVFALLAVASVRELRARRSAAGRTNEV